MEVLSVLISLCLILIGLFIIVSIVIGVGAVLLQFWPALIGVVGGVMIWVEGHDNWGVIFALIFLGIQIVWSSWYEDTF